MKLKFLLTSVLVSWLPACHSGDTKRNTLPDQLVITSNFRREILDSSFQNKIYKNFTEHLKNTDSSLALNTFFFLWADTLSSIPKLRMVKNVYSMELNRINRIVSNQVQSNPGNDSINLVKDKMAYLKTEIDSVSQALLKEDSSRKYGILLGYAYTFSKNDKTGEDTVFYFLDNRGYIMNSNAIDEIIKRDQLRLK